MERNLIKYYDTMNPEKGYNMETGGSGGKVVSASTKRKHSEVSKGHTVSEETRKKISRANKGRLLGDNNPSKREDVKRKISEANKGKLGWVGETNPSKRPDVRKKISEAKKAWSQKKVEEYNHYRFEGGQLKWKEYLKYTSTNKNIQALEG